jgi:hypothetical protein
VISTCSLSSIFIATSDLADALPELARSMRWALDVYDETCFRSTEPVRSGLVQGGRRGFRCHARTGLPGACTTSLDVSTAAASVAP